MEQELAQGTYACAMILTLDSSFPPDQHPAEVQLLLQEFGDVFPKELSNKLPPMCDVQHAIEEHLYPTFPITASTQLSMLSSENKLRNS